MVQFLDPLLIVALALNFVALGVSRIRGVINAVAAPGDPAGDPRRCSSTRRSGSAASCWSS